MAIHSQLKDVDLASFRLIRAFVIRLRLSFTNQNIFIFNEIGEPFVLLYTALFGSSRDEIRGDPLGY